MYDKRFSRLFAILSHLSPHSQVTIDDLAKRFEVSQRTICRDIKILESASLGIFWDHDKLKISRVGYRKIKSWISA